MYKEYEQPNVCVKDGRKAATNLDSLNGWDANQDQIEKKQVIFDDKWKILKRLWVSVIFCTCGANMNENINDMLDDVFCLFCYELSFIFLWFVQNWLIFIYAILQLIDDIMFPNFENRPWIYSSLSVQIFVQIRQVVFVLLKNRLVAFFMCQ